MDAPPRREFRRAADTPIISPEPIPEAEIKSDGGGDAHAKPVYTNIGRMAPNGIPWEKWRKSENIEDSRAEDEAEYQATQQKLAEAREILSKKMNEYQQTIKELSEKYGDDSTQWPPEVQRKADIAFKVLQKK